MLLTLGIDWKAKRDAYNQRKADKQVVKAFYDAAQTTSDNKNHWANADAFDANQSNSPLARAIVRQRVRYERDNNSLLEGIIETYISEVIGKGPRLQVRGYSEKDNQKIEKEFRKWFRGINGLEILRTAISAKLTDGEVFIIETNKLNNKLSPVTLNYEVVECDRVTDPEPTIHAKPNEHDGIKYDPETKEPIAYYVLDEHPGSFTNLLRHHEYTQYNADKIIHIFKKRRPGQLRGISEFVMSIPSFAKFRAYVQAVLKSAHIAAMFSAVMETKVDYRTEGGAPKVSNIGATLPISEGLTVLPENAMIKQLKAEQPTAEFKEFRKAMVAEFARSIGMPYNVAAADSSGHNFSSANLDRSTWWCIVEIIRELLDISVLDRMVASFLHEAQHRNILPKSFTRNPRKLEALWFWPGNIAIDPLKIANTRSTNLKSKSTNFKKVYADQGLDWKEELRQCADEADFIREHNIPVADIPDAAGVLEEEIRALVESILEDRKDEK